MKQNINEDFKFPVKCYSTEEYKTNEIWIDKNGKKHPVCIKSFRGQWPAGYSHILIPLSNVDWKEILYPLHGYLKSVSKTIYDLNSPVLCHTQVFERDAEWEPNSIFISKDYNTETFTEFEVTLKYVKN